MALNTKVKWFSHSMYGAPQIVAGGAGTSGKVVELLDAFLVDGFGMLTQDSITVSGGVATATRSAGNPFLLYQVIEVAGVASPAGLNGQWRVSEVVAGGSQIRFECAGIADGAASGTITIKTPGLGWERVFSDTNKRVYRSITGNARSYYRFDDDSSRTSAAYGASLAAYAAMTDIDTGVGAWGGATVPGGDARAFPRFNHPYYFVVGDDKTLYWIGEKKQLSSSVAFATLGAFGEFYSFKPNDGENEFILLSRCGSAGSEEKPAGLHNAITPSTYLTGVRFLRGNTSGTPNVYWYSCGGASQTIGGQSGGGLPYPSLQGNDIVFSDSLFRQSDSGGDCIRGKFRGAFWSLTVASLANQYLPQILTNIVGMDGRVIAYTYETQQSSNSSQTYAIGRGAFDIIGPWD